MPYYRCFFVDARGHFHGVDECASQDDDLAFVRAMSAAKANRRGYFELWQHDRLVASTRPNIKQSRG